MSAKSKQSNIRIVEGGKKDQSDAGSSKKRKEKITNYTYDNAKRKEVAVSGSLEHDELVFQNLSPTPMELKILELPPEYVQSGQHPTKISAANDLDDDFQDPPHPKNNKEKEKSPRHANVPKRSKPPLPKRQAKQRANVASYTCTKKNVEIKSSVASEIPSTSKSLDFSISRDEFDQFKISGDGVKVTQKVPTDNVDQFEEPSRHSPSELNCQSIYNDLNDQEKVVRVTVPSFNPEVSIHHSHLQSPTGHSGFSPLGQQFNTPEPQVIY
ncbi:hypothetical protein KY285_021839 [Solanum tuberosum]|nr:hypothetical protein KY289_022122 [Solanum tuberosum]KAH0694742.1 hypothetical protein KY285_021839 [Solanum tuberosum]